MRMGWKTALCMASAVALGFGSVARAA
ncbi:MAG: hypothetical protein RIS85_302, partial [Pseudomonadota bacterium]